MRFCLLDADYDGTEIKMFGVDEHGKSVLVVDEYGPYIYVDAKNKSAIKEKLKKSRLVLKIEEVKRKIGLEEKLLLKVFVDLPQNLSRVRDLIKHNPAVADVFEYTIPFYKRYLIDKKIYPFSWIDVDGEEIKEKSGYSHAVKSNKLSVLDKKTLPKMRVLAFDTEVVDKEIIMISLVSGSYRKILTYKKCSAAHCEVLKSEKEMLQRFIELVNEQDPDVVVGFNSDEFDFQVIRERCDFHKIEAKINRDGSSLRTVRRAHISAAKLRGRLHIDLFNFVENILAPQMQLEAITLSEVSEELLGESKLEISFEEILDAWKKGKIDYLAEYCLKDSLLTYRLAEMMLPQITEISRVSGQLPFDTSRLTYGLLVEWFFVRRASEKGIISPNQPHWDEIQRRRLQRPYKGGYVMEPKLGLHDNIAVFDFRSLYPSIIVTFNISPETLNCSCCRKNGHKVPGMKYHFCRKHHGFVSDVVKEIIEERVKIKNELKKHRENSEEFKQLNEQQYAVKILANASYGILGFAGARWYCRECAESSSAFGRHYIKQTMDKAKKSFELLYGDTDSLMVSFRNEKDVEQFREKTNKELPGIMELELQGLYLRGIFVPQKLGTYVAKKRYALIDKKGVVTVRGFEAVRRDWCDLAKNLQHEVLRLVLKGKEKEAASKVRGVIRKVKSRKVSLSDLAIRTMLGKELEEYKATGPHTAVAKKLEKEGHVVRQGMVLSYVITKRKGSVSEKAESIEKVSLKDYDVDYYVNKQILSVALRVLQVLGYKESDFMNGLKKFAK
ncbi:MAG: ribonuclease H-like domain-containing protein [Candidatus Aenigmarchaeota archaeon]|nr:ribonuclease H-like domain-containing protein [Candidatus Aenigmarchaeota archaeon]